MIEKLEAQAARIDLNAVANIEISQHPVIEVDQHVIHTAVLAGDDSFWTLDRVR